MSTDANSSVRMENNVVLPNSNNNAARNSHYQPPAISEKTQRELQASAEQFMQAHRQQQLARAQSSSPSASGQPAPPKEYNSLHGGGQKGKAIESNDSSKMDLDSGGASNDKSD